MTIADVYIQMDGNELGPFFETGCRNWHYRECPKGLEIVNYVILIIIILLFIINMIRYLQVIAIIYNSDQFYVG